MTMWQPKKTSGALLTVVLTVLALSSCGGDSKSGESDQDAMLAASPELVPPFTWDQSDYAVRCKDANVGLSFDLPDGWSGQVDGSEIVSGASETDLPMKQGQARVVSLRKPGESRARDFHLRCLPDDFPPFEVSTSGDGGPRLTMAQLNENYAAAFDSRGAPVWWFKALGAAEDAQFLADGTIAFAPIKGFVGKVFEVRTLEGKLIRRLRAANGLGTDLHDLILLPNGNYLIGAHKIFKGVDTSRFGGKKSSSIDSAQIQELRPDGSLVWKWTAYPQIKLAESGRWWQQMHKWGQPYDVHHWNSVDRKGNYLLMSFRHLDAVLRIDRRTGDIVWKLGGTKTKKRLKVTNDPQGRYPFGGQHDARLQPDGTITVFDNQTDLSGKWKNVQPRAVQYRVDTDKNQAELLTEIKDPRVKGSIGFGSAELYPNGNWLVGWGARGKDGLIGGYDPDGKPNFTVETPGGVSYRANGVKGPSPSVARLRGAMDEMYERSK